MYTTQDYKYLNWFSVEHKDYLYFGVRACSDVHILLTEKIGFQNGFSYEIVLGGWSNSRYVLFVPNRLSQYIFFHPYFGGILVTGLFFLCTKLT